MPTIGHLCRAALREPRQTQRQMAKGLGISLGKCHGLIRAAVSGGYIREQNGALALTEQGEALLEGFRMENAIILASNIDVRFVPFTHETPKSLMEIEGERIIERQIRQLREGGITDITVVVGYLAERFEYLVDKYGVSLIYNPEYTTKSNVASLYLTRHLLGNTYLLIGDHWLWDNLFQPFEPSPWACCHWHEGPTSAWTARTNGHRRILALNRGGRDQLALQGPVCFTRELSHKLRGFIEQEYALGLESERWETALAGHMGELTLYAHVRHPDTVQSFHTLEELRDFDLQYAERSGNRNLRQIAAIFEVPEGLIRGLRWLDVGMANRSFHFELDGKAYIYRIPGPGSENLVIRKHEAAVYKTIGGLGIADEVVCLDPVSGVKVSRFYDNIGHVNMDDWGQISAAMAVLRRLHDAAIQVKHSFDIEEKLERFEALCRRLKCVRFEDYEGTRARLEEPLRYIREQGGARVLCHMDAAHVNFLVGRDGALRLLDWEYAGLCHPLADVAMFGVFGSFSQEQMDKLLALYLGREPSRHEQLLCYSYCACGGLLWSLWAEYRQYLGEDFGAYAMQQYRAAKDYVRIFERTMG